MIAVPEPITVSQLIPRNNTADINSNERKVLQTNLDFTTEQTYRFGFTLQQQQRVFRVPRTVFIDNSVGTKRIEVTVDVTGQFFPVPAYCTGFFSLDCVENSVIDLYCEGDATDLVTVGFYDYQRPPVVWDSFGPLIPGFKVQVIGEDGVNRATVTNPLAVGGLNDDSGDVDTFHFNSDGEVKVAGVFNLAPVKGAALAPAIVNVGTAATLIAAANANLVHRELQNNSDETLFIGPVGVTIATGYPIFAGYGYVFNDMEGPIYGVYTTAPHDVNVMQW